jgi:cation:H+ antiporter
VNILQFSDNPLWLNLLAFAAAAAVVWFAGTNVSKYAQTISERTGLGAAFVGLILLGGITSLPEVAVTVSAGLTGNAALAVNNLLGGVAMQVAILAIADAFIGRDALSSIVVEPVIMLQATLDILLLFVIASGIAVGETAVVGVGVWSTGILLLYVLSVWLVSQYQGRRTWVPRHASEAEPADSADRPEERESNGDDGRAALRRSFERLERELDARSGGRRPRGTPDIREPEPAEDAGGSSEDEEEQREERNDGRGGLKKVILKTVAAGLAILAAGYVLSRTGEAIATQTGLGSSFAGAVLVAISTSLPEVSTVLSAMRLREYSMAFSDIFGTNLFDLALVFVVDAVYAGPPVLDEVGTFSLFAALLGIAVTAVYIAGLVERKDRTLARMGYDSLVVVLLYFGGLAVLYTLR